MSITKAIKALKKPVEDDEEWSREFMHSGVFDAKLFRAGIESQHDRDYYLNQPAYERENILKELQK